MKVKIDQNLCRGRGRCYSNEPDLFGEGEDGKGVIKIADIPDDDIDTQSAARAASMMCPMGAIEIEE